MTDDDLRAEIRAAQARHAAVAEEVRGRRVPYFRVGELSVPAFKMAAGGDPRVEGRAQTLKLMSGAARFPVDCLFFDLEDAAPDRPDWKPFARAYAAEALLSLDFGERVVAFRPNNVRTSEFEDDVLHVIGRAGHKLDALVLPKTETADEVRDVASIVRRVAARAGVDRSIGLEVLIESPRAWTQAQQIAAIPEVTALSFGAWDFARTIGGEVDAHGWLADQAVARQMLPIVAAAEGKEALDAVTATLPVRPAKPADVSDADYRGWLAGAFDDAPPALQPALAARQAALALAHRDAQDARRLGFAGKWVLHPDQIAPIQSAWTPSRERALTALKLAAAYARAAEQGSGAELDHAASAGPRLADKAVVGADWWHVLAGLRRGVLGPDDVAATGVPWAVLERTVVSRAAQTSAPRSGT
jgi:citrate lyase beta subunit